MRPHERHLLSGNQIGCSLWIVHLSWSLGQLHAWQARNRRRRPRLALRLLNGPVRQRQPPSGVGACNKNGLYWALAANPLGSAPLRADTIGAPCAPGDMCLASSVWNWPAGARFASSDPTVTGGTGYRGSVCQVDPATGAYMWQAGPPCAVTGTPSLDGAGVLAAGTHSCPGGRHPPAPT